ncbi:MAG: hypothetical protein HYY12_01680 [Candidatus Methylomirabilis oxyfera]|nr:hypothetical protein [Candidatus Methylomirabilis oxyfera]
MSAPSIVVASIVAIAVLFVLLPVVADTLRRFRSKQSLRCPETGREAEVSVDAHQAAWTSAFGRALLRVKMCSLWPQREGCAQDCLHLIDTEAQGSQRPPVHQGR